MSQWQLGAIPLSLLPLAFIRRWFVLAGKGAVYKSVRFRQVCSIPCVSTSILGSQTSVRKRLNQVNSGALLPKIQFPWGVDQGFAFS